jgi:dTDP-L-rhamnose 4-epimerase
MTTRRERGEQRKREPRPRPALPAGEIYQAVGRTARRYPWRILAISVAVAALTTLVEFGVGDLINEGNWAEALFGSVCLTGSSMLGSVFLSGVLVRLAGVAEHGQRDPRISTVLRALPWGALILADLLVTLAFVVGALLLIIPGLVALVLFCVAGPVIEIEHRRAVAGMRRSVQLVRQRFWKVALIAGLPLLVANWLESELPEPHGAEDIVTALVVWSAGEGVLEALIGLLLVEVCYRLIAAERVAAAALTRSSGRSMARVAANRLPGASRATRAASCAVSTSTSSGTWRTRGRLVLASSMVVYGEGAYDCAEHGRVRPAPRSEAHRSAGWFEPRCPQCSRELSTATVTEDAPLDPRNAYAASKVAQEHLAATWARMTGGSAVALRYHNVYVPRDTPYSGVAAIFRSALEAGRAPQCSRTASSAATSCTSGTWPGPTWLRAGAEGELRAFNVASGEPHTVGEMADALATAFGGPAPEVTGRYRLGDVRHVVPSPEAAAAGLGFRAETSFSAGMAEFAHAPLRRPARGSGLAVKPGPARQPRLLACWPGLTGYPG